MAIICLLHRFRFSFKIKYLKAVAAVVRSTDSSGCHDTILVRYCQTITFEQVVIEAARIEVVENKKTHLIQLGVNIRSTFKDSSTSFHGLHIAESDYNTSKHYCKLYCTEFFLLQFASDLSLC